LSQLPAQRWAPGKLQEGASLFDPEIQNDQQ
ncbi:unnamed protein product, partial [marine sediment metagenome]